MSTQAHEAGVTEAEYNDVMESIHSPAPTEKQPAKYVVQVWNTDSYEWETDDTFEPTSKFNAESDARQLKRRCSYPIRTRVVKW